jgi:single-strand DNA-binding protein
MFHRITVIGHIGNKPELRYTPDGTPVTTLSVATKTSISKQRTERCPAGWKESLNGKNWEMTSWTSFDAWRSLAETCVQYLEKGSQVYVEGTLKGTVEDGTQYPRVYETNSGDHRCNFEYTASLVKFLGQSGGRPASPVGEPPPERDDEDSLPF